jgi:ATP-binding cassette subfamily F protein uup
VILLDADRVAASRPGRPLFRDVSVTLADGDRLGVVGLNGCGKSTLLRILAGLEAPESGEVRRGRDVRISMLEQDPAPGAATVREAVVAARPDAEWEADAVLDRLGLAPLAERSPAALSGGQVKRVALARALVAPCDLLILDEPTNHLDLDTIAWLEERLGGHRGGLVLVTHDRHVLDRLTTRVLELDRGRAYVHDGGYDAYLEGRARREGHAQRAEARRRNLARTELAWLRRGAPARTSKPRARVAAATAVVEGRPQAAARAGELPLHAATPRLGDRVVELRGVHHRHADGPELLRDVELLLDPRERLGIVGPNGSGKSTLLDLIAGRIEPTHGTVERGPTVRIGYYDQRGRDLDPRQRVRDAVAGPGAEADWADAALMEAFWFDGDAQWAPIGLLSGGERRRLQLLLTLAARPNVLLLDEPTNDLDLDTLRQLEDLLDDWPGALVVVSHDRAFLERTVTDVIVLEGDGRAARRPGGYAAYEDERRARRRSGRVDAGSTPRRRSADTTVGGGTPAPSDAPRVRPTSPSTLRHRLRVAERELADLQARHDEVEQLLADAAASGDHVRVAELGRELAEVSAALGPAEERWLELASELEARGLAG